MKKIIQSTLILLLACIHLSTAQELIPRSINPNGIVNDMERKGEVLYVGGNFREVGYITGGIAYLPNHSDLPDLNFPHIQGKVLVIIPDGNGGWFMGGEFSQVGPLSMSNLVHIHADYQIDADFKPSFNNEVLALALKDNILYVGGIFGNVENSGRNYLVAYDLNTNSLTNFNPNPNRIVNDLEIYGDHLLVGGFFTTVSGVEQRGLAKISLESGSPVSFPSPGLGTVYDMLVDGDSLYVGGTFQGGLMGIDLVNNTEMSWSPIVTGWALSMSVQILEKVDTVLYFGGRFNSVNGITRYNLAAVGLSGNLQPFQPDPNEVVVGLRHHDDSIYVAGEFTELNGLERSFCAKVDLQTGNPSDWSLELDWEANEMFLVNDDLMVGGEFSLLHGIERDNAYAFNLSSGEILDWKPETNFYGLTDLLIDRLRDVVYLAGYGQNGKYLLATDASNGDSLAGWDFTSDNLVRKIDQDLVTGNIFIAGDFTTVKEQPRKYLAGLDPDGNLLPLDVEIDNTVHEVAVAPDFNTIYFSGQFENVDGNARDKIAAINLEGELLDWAPQPLLSGLNLLSEVYQIAPKGDTIFIGGRFDTLDGIPRKDVAAVDAINGNLFDWDVQSESLRITTLIPDDKGVLLADNTLTALGTFPVNSIAYVDILSGLPLYTVPDMGFGNSDITSLIPHDSLLWIGGSFWVLNQKVNPGLVTIPFDFSLGAPTKNVSRIYPTEGGNTGDVTIEIVGVGFDEGTSFSLNGEDIDEIVSNRDLTFNYDEKRILATFDLREAPIGTRNIELTIPGDTTLVLTDAFEIVQGTEALPWSEVIAPDFVTTNRPETFYLSYGNKGNIDANGVPIWVTFSPNIEVLDMSFDILRIMEPDNPYYDSIPDYALIDTLLGEPYEAKLYAFVIPRIEANSSKMARFTVKGTGDGNFYTRAWASEPMYGSPLKYAVGDCMDTFIEKVVGFAPFGGCAYGIVDLATSPVFDYIYDPDFNDAYAQNYLETAGWTALQCAADAVGPGVGGVSVRIIKEIVAAKDIYDVADKCLTPEEKEDREGEFISSCDPNDKSSLQGRGAGNWLNTIQRFPFMIRFENEAEATAPAKMVVVKDTLDQSAFELNTLELKGFEIANTFYTIPPGYSEYTMEVDLRPRLPYLVQSTTEIDKINGILTWTFTTLDTLTKEEITDPTLGFLPPNADTVSGQGAIFFDLDARKGLPPGTTISNRAANIFDFNAPLLTNTWSINLDNQPPESAVNELPETTFDEEITISWSGTDQGAGIRYYDVHYKQDDGPWNYLAVNTRESSLQLQVETGSTYEFYSVAYDSAFNKESRPSKADASVRIVQITGIEDAKKGKSIQVYPVPASGYLNIYAKSSMSTTRFRLVNIMGMMVDVWSVHAGISKSRRNLGDLRPGIYILQWENHTSKDQIKLIIE